MTRREGRERFPYDGTGPLAARTTTSGTQEFTWAFSQSVPLLLSDGTKRLHLRRGRLGDRANRCPGQCHLRVHDQLGSARLLADQNGDVIGKYSYGPYGQVTIKTGPGSTLLGFAGQYTDTQTGLVHMHARYYDPGTGQFISSDPLVNVTGKPCAYVDGDPVDVTDPQGLSGWNPFSLIGKAARWSCG